MSGSLATPPYANVEVNLNIEVMAEGQLELLSQPVFTPANVVCATEKVAASSLYDVAGECAMFEFWEDDVDGISASLANSNINGNSYDGWYKKSARRLAKDLQKVLCGQMEANKQGVVRPGVTTPANFTTTPFNDAKYAGSAQYQTHEHFGRLALACYAHHLFGHVQSTAAITNDSAFMANMLSLNATDKLAPSNTAAERYASYKHDALVGASGEAEPINNWIPSVRGGGVTDADLAIRLVGALLNANRNADGSLITSTVDKTNALNSAKRAADIVDQVIGGDASRARDEDNSKYGPERHGLLRFYAGDVIYVAITLATPQVTVGSNQVSSAALLQNYTSAETYMIRIVLE